MKQRSTKIITSLLLLIPIVVAAAPHPAFAFLGFSKDDIFWITAWLSEIEMAFAGAMLTIVGSLLNATMTATLNMSTIVSNTPAIGVAWTTIRDFGSVFIIFMLLDVSIRMILGGGEGVGKLIKNIVIAGLLINFSLFFTKLAVDASNIISLSFYNAIAPSGLGQTGTSVNSSGSLGGSFVNLVSGAFNDGGLSNVFMQSLDLQGFANSAPAANTLANSTSTISEGGISYWNITLANTGGAILMFFAAVSFLVAAIAFAVRIGVLIMLMAFSPILFIGMIFPDLEKYRKKWSGMLYAMCLFMPVYLLLMYVAISVLSDPHFFCFAQTGVTAACPAASGVSNVTGGNIGGLIGPSTIGIVLQYIIAIFLINAPLMAAISIASEGADFMSDMMKKVSKWGQGAISGSQKWAVQRGWRETGGRAANALAKNEGFRNWAARSTVGDFLHKGTQGIASDYSEASEKRAEKQDKRRKELGFDETKMASLQDRIGRVNARIAREKAAGNDTSTSENAIRALRKQALDLETSRAKDFAAKTSVDDPTFMGMGGLFNRLTRNSPVASAKAKTFVHEKEMKRSEELLDEQKKDLKDIQKEINGAATSTQDPVTKLWTGTAAQESEKTRILGEISKHTKTVEQHKSAIRNLELESKKII